MGLGHIQIPTNLEGKTHRPRVVLKQMFHRVVYTQHLHILMAPEVPPGVNKGFRLGDVGATENQTLRNNLYFSGVKSDSLCL